MESIKIFLRKTKAKSKNMAVNNIKLFLRIKGKTLGGYRKKNMKYGENKTASQIKPCLCFLFCVAAIKKPFLPI